MSRRRERYRPLRFGQLDERIHWYPVETEDPERAANGVVHLPGEMDGSGVLRCLRCREIIVDARGEAVTGDLGGLAPEVTAYPGGIYYDGRDPSATDCAAVPGEP